MNSKEASVALETVSLGIVVIKAEMALEAFDAEVDHLLLRFLLHWNFRLQVQIFVKLASLSLEHHLEDLLHSDDVLLEVNELAFEHFDHMIEYS